MCCLRQQRTPLQHAPRCTWLVCQRLAIPARAQCARLALGLEGSMTPERLLENFRDDTWSNTCVMLLRFITSAEIKRRADHFAPFVLVSGGGRRWRWRKG
jgi:hypothetical protein